MLITIKESIANNVKINGIDRGIPILNGYKIKRMIDMIPYVNTIVHKNSRSCICLFILKYLSKLC